MEMKEIPIVKIKRGKIKQGEKIWKRGEAVDKIEDMIKKYGMVYIIDVDGYNKNSPNLSFYKKIGKKLWIDAFPRRVEDVIDLIVIGAERITIGDMNEKNIKELKELCEKDIFISGGDVRKIYKKMKEYGLSGLVIKEGQEIIKVSQVWKIYGEVIRRVR